MNLIKSIQKVIEKDNRVVFAYLYGSVLEGDKYRDIDIGIYITEGYDPFIVSSNLEIALSIETGISPDNFDIRVINQVNSLLYLRRVINGHLLVDKNPDMRGDFIESFSMQYREAEGILMEAYNR
jgi:predicted nucleotidyltransferase